MRMVLFDFLYRGIGGEIVNPLGYFSLQVIDRVGQIAADFADCLGLIFDGCFHLTDFLSDG